MSRSIRTLVAFVFGGSLLFAQLPNPLNLPDPLGLSKKPVPRPSEPSSPREGRRDEGKVKRGHHDNGKHKGKEKREYRERDEDRERGERKGHDRH